MPKSKRRKTVEQRPMSGIAIRLQKGLIEELKLIAQLSGERYQSMIRRVLTRAANDERRKLNAPARRRAQEKPE